MVSFEKPKLIQVWSIRQIYKSNHVQRFGDPDRLSYPEERRLRIGSLVVKSSATNLSLPHLVGLFDMANEIGVCFFTRLDDLGGPGFGDDPIPGKKTVLAPLLVDQEAGFVFPDPSHKSLILWFVRFSRRTRASLPTQPG